MADLKCVHSTLHITRDSIMAVCGIIFKMGFNVWIGHHWLGRRKNHCSRVSATIYHNPYSLCAEKEGSEIRAGHFVVGKMVYRQKELRVIYLCWLLFPQGAILSVWFLRRSEVNSYGLTRPSSGSKKWTFPLFSSALEPFLLLLKCLAFACLTAWSLFARVWPVKITKQTMDQN